MSPHEHHTRKILTEIETGRPVTQGRLSRELGPAERGTPDGLLTDKRIVCYGAGEVAEIGYISLQATDLRLVGTRRVFV